MVPKSRSRAPTTGSATAPEPLAEVVTAPQTDADENGSGIDWSNVKPRSVQFLVPCTLRKVISEKTKLLALTEGAVLPESEPVTQTIHLLVTATLVPRSFTLSTNLLNFSAVPVGKHTTKTLIIKNRTPNTITPKSHGLNPYGPFTLLHPIRTIPPNTSQTLAITFTPSTESTSMCLFTLSDAATTTRVQLLGQGVVPTVDVLTDELNMGDVLVNEPTSKPFSIKNHSPFPITFKISLLSPPGSLPNWSGISPFSVSEWEGTIPASTSSEIQVKFAPDRESDNFFDFVKVDVWGLGREILVPVFGRCWDTTTMVGGYDRPPKGLVINAVSFPPKFELEYLHELITGGGDEGDLSGFLGDVEEGKVKGLEGVGELLNRTTRCDFRFVTHSCEWVRDKDGGWGVDVRDLVVGNMKVGSGGAAGGAGKEGAKGKSPVAEFLVEPFEGSFVFDEGLGRFRVVGKQVVTAESFRFFVEPMKGTLEVGASKGLKIGLGNPIADFW
ncbi:hypothetical protein HK097_006145, partial [Rhizophlyctis rosea]